MAIHGQYILCAIFLSNGLTTLTLFIYFFISQYIIINKKASILMQKGQKISYCQVKREFDIMDCLIKNNNNGFTNYKS